MSNDIKVTVSAEDFKRKSPSEQSYTIYKAVSEQQSKCILISEGFEDRLGAIEIGRRLDKAKVAGIGIGSGSGAAALYTWVKSLFQ